MYDASGRYVIESSDRALDSEGLKHSMFVGKVSC